MAFENKDNAGALFTNDRKSKDNQPDWTGNAKVVCESCKHATPVFVSAWVKQPDPDKPEFFSLSFTPKSANGNDAAQQPEQQQPAGKPDKAPARPAESRRQPVRRPAAQPK
jgi:hypothetical protein